MKSVKLHRTVLLLGAASFFNDISSEMIYPMLPIFLSSVVGAGTVYLGLIEGFAESAASFLKVASGIWTDRMKQRNPFILSGYFVAGLARSLIGAAHTWPFIFVLRFFDRVGKGVRTSPRDALIADVTPEESRGRAYGFHRAMDHAGAVLGPLAAAALLHWGGLSLKQVFFCAAIPAACVMVVLLMMKSEPTPLPPALQPEVSPALSRSLPREFKIFLSAVLLFELGGSTDAFLLLRLADIGIAPAVVAILWSVLHVVKMASNYWLGYLSDRMDRRSLLLCGWTLYALLYTAIGFTTHRVVTVILFLLYGVYFGLTEPTERAMISHWAHRHNRGHLFGYYHGTVGLAALPAGLLFGYFWKTWGASSAFYMAAGLSAMACLLLWRARPGS